MTRIDRRLDLSQPREVEAASSPPRITDLRAMATPWDLRQVDGLTHSLRRHASERPHHAALLDPGQSVTISYAELERRVQTLAAQLEGWGLGPDDRLAVALDRSVELIVTLLAILEVGATYVPLDPAYPAERLLWMLDDAACHRLLVRRGHRMPWVATAAVEVVEIESGPNGGPVLANPPPSEPLGAHRPARPPAHPEAAAYIIYTSGSSGRPKGVVIPRRALAWYDATCVARYRLSPDDRLLQVASISFDISVGEIFPTLAAGATLVLGDPRPTDAVELLRMCRGLEITVLFPATALWHELARALSEDPGRCPERLRLVSFGGEKVATARLEDWRRAVGDRIRLVNGYGPTEATVEASHQELLPVPDGGARAPASSIGHPLPEVTARIVDSRFHAVAEGVEGELCLASPGLARGYQARPAATAERFVPDPFGGRPGGRLYRTGDRVRRTDGGRLEILGRLDEQTKIRGFRVEPAEIETHLADHPAVAEAAVVAAGAEGERWLSAFVVPHDTTDATTPGHDTPREVTGSGAGLGATGILGVGTLAPSAGRRALDERDLRDFLRRRLPSYLVPQRITLLDGLPLNPNGKIDRPALVEQSESRVERAEILEGPGQGKNHRSGSPLEARLTRLLCEGLRIRRVALDDNFFELGGDSILGIRIATLARRRGLNLTPADLFSHPTVAALAATLEERGDDGLPKRVEVTERGIPTSDPLPLTPVQHWLIDDADLAEPWHFNQSMMMALRRPLPPQRLRRVVARLLAHHDALRLRFERADETLPPGRRRLGPGPWRQRHAARETTDPVTHLDLSHLPPRIRHTTLARAADTLQSSLDLHRGPLLRVALLTDGDPQGGADRLLIVVHHLVVDGVSWGILLGDLERLLSACEAGEALDLGARTTSYGRWAELQVSHARSQVLRDELAFWLDRPQGATPLPLDPVRDPTSDPTSAERRREANTSETVAYFSCHLDRRRSELLLRRVGVAYRTRINDLLLTALALAIRRWSGGDLLLDLEGHGREEIFPGVDLSRTVGWFTSTFPIHLRLPVDSANAAENGGNSGGNSEGNGASGDARRFGVELGTALVAVKEQLRALPHQGVGHGMLYYLADDETRQRLRALPRPEISFNYLGQLDTLLAGSRFFAPCTEDRGREKGRGGRRDYLLEVDGGIVDGRLWIHWQYSQALHHESTIARLAEDFLRALAALVDHCLDPAHGALTPSDVPLAGLDATSLAQLITKPREIEDLYPLAPTQHGMLFHALLDRGTGPAPQNAPTYFEQSSWQLEGTLDRKAFRQAWQRLIDRHGILRTAFRWAGLDHPLQVVFRRRALPWSEHDWRTLDPAEQELRIARFLDHDRQQGFDLEQAPLTRVALLRLGHRSHRFVWSYHHTLLDGWSISALFDELFASYDALRRNRPVPEVATVPFRRYIAWLDERANDPAREKLFRRLLADARPTPPPYGHPERTGANGANGSGPRQQRRTRQLPATLGQALGALARRQHLTTGTLTQGMWSLLLARAQGHDDVAYGLTVSGRPAELPGADHIVGLMINSLPVRWRAAGDRPLLPWLREIQRTMVELGRHEHVSLVEVRRIAGLPADRPLFECLLVFENYPVEELALEERQRRGDLVIDDFRGFSETHYPLTLAVVPGRSWRLDLSWDPRRLDPTASDRLLRHLENLLADLVRRLDRHGTAIAGGPTLADLELLSPAERHQLVVEWSPATGAKTAAARPLHPETHQRPVVSSSDAPQAPAIRAAEGSLPDRLAALWRAVLAVDTLPHGANFFELGGHSLLAMRLVAQLRQTLGVELPLRRLFENPTLAGLATVVGETLRQHGRAGHQPPLVAGPRPERPPLAPSQRRLWILERLEPGHPAHHVAGAWRLGGKLDLPALRRALVQIRERHEALRTTFPEDDGEPWQRIAPPHRAPENILPRVDLRPLAPRLRPAAERRLADAQALRPFDLATGPLERLLLVQSADDVFLFVRCCHHIVTDAWSEGLFYHELGLLYGALIERHPSPLLPLAAQPADAARLQLAALDTPAFEERLTRRRNHLAEPHELRLPTDHPPAGPYRAGHQRHRLGSDLTERMSHHAIAHGASPFMALVALFSAFLHRLGAGETLAFGSPVAHRPTTEHGRLIGFFVETVIFRLEVGRQAHFDQLLAHGRDIALDAWGDQDIPFDRLVEALAPTRCAGRSPLVRVMVDWIDQPAESLRFGEAEGHWVELAGSSGSWDLSLTGWRRGESLILDLEYDASRFDATTIRRWLLALERLAEAALEHPHHPLHRLALLGAAERHQLVVESTGADRGPSLSLAETLALYRQQTPDAPAVIDGSSNQHWTWDELARRVEHWQDRLDDAGLAIESPVAVLAERRPETLAATLAIWTLGGLWMPLDPSTPGELLRRMTQRAGTRIAIGSPTALAALGPTIQRALAFEDPPSPAGPPAGPPRSPRHPPTPRTLHPLQAAALLHTSGSTGEPKAVVLGHRALVGYGDDARRAYGLGAHDRVLQFAHWTFDLLLEEIVPALLAGATLVLRDEASAASAEAFAAFCDHHRITFATLPTAFWHRLGDVPLATVERLVIGGEKASPDALARWRRRQRPVLHDTYGPTEATVVVTRVPPGRVTPETPHPGGETLGGDLGRPIAGSRVLVLDSELRPLPLGAEGELVLAGDGLARGYHARPAATAERFVPDPFAEGSATRPAGGRLYRSGDRGRWSGGGCLQYLGRLDRQLKIRGFRVEPVEVETALGQHPAVEAVVVDAWNSAGDAPRLVAWIVPRTGPPPPTPDTLRAWLGERLPAYLHPTVWVWLAELPLDRRGKIDRRRLPPPLLSGNGSEAPGDPPRGPVEEALARVWLQVLGPAVSGPVGLARDVDFFRLGGDSLLAIQVTDGARREGLPMRPMDLMAHPTLAELGVVLERRSAAERKIPEAFAPETSSAPGPLALTPIQRWFFDWPIEKRWHFNQSVLLAATEPLDPARLARATARLTHHHDALRLRFERRNGGWRSFQTPPGDPPPLVHWNLAHLAPETAEAQLASLCASLQASLDLARGPIVRAGHFVLPGGSERLLIVVHHLAVDGVSWPILLDDLERVYTSTDDDPNPLPPKTTSYRHWSRTLEAWARRPELLDEVSHWRRTLDRLHPLPVDRRVASADRGAPAHALHSSWLGSGPTRELLERAARRLEPLLLTALLRTLGAWSDRRALLIELESHGRSEALPGIDVSRTVGWFTSTFPVWLELEGADPAAQISAVARQLAATPHAGLHYGLLRYLAPEVDGLGELRRQPGPEVSFNYLGQVDLALARSHYFRPAPEDPGPEQGHPGERQHRFDLNGRVVGGRLVMDWSYDPGCYQAQTVEDLGRAYYEQLRELVARC